MPREQTAFILYNANDRPARSYTRLFAGARSISVFYPKIFFLSVLNDSDVCVFPSEVAYFEYIVFFKLE